MGKNILVLILITAKPPIYRTKLHIFMEIVHFFSTRRPDCASYTILARSCLVNVLKTWRHSLFRSWKLICSRLFFCFSAYESTLLEYFSGHQKCPELYTSVRDIWSFEISVHSFLFSHIRNKKVWRMTAFSIPNC